VSRDPLAVIDAVLRGPADPPRVADYATWKRTWHRTVDAWETPIDRAFMGGLNADRPAWALAAGYQAALQALVPTLPPEKTAAICVTEQHGTHPSRMLCRLTAPAAGESGWRLDGRKTFVTGAQAADLLLVAASIGVSAEGRNRLRTAVVPARLPGVDITPLPDLGFVPELPHGQVHFHCVALADEALLPGDGYAQAVKPFRTLEDVHVTGAFLGWFFAVGRRSDWPDGIRESLLALMAAVRLLALAPPTGPHVHLALGGLLHQVARLTDKMEPLWERVDSQTRQWWRRDCRVLDIAAAVRSRRLETARAHFRALGNHS